MKYIYDFARLPPRPGLIQQINAAASRLAPKLDTLKMDGLGISELHQRVVAEKQNYLTINLQAFSFVAAWALRNVKGPLSEVSLLECGGGIGLLSLLARELGVGTVVYNDIYDVACRDAEIIAKHIGLAADHYVEGDIDQLQAFCRRQSVAFNAIGSFDVIEHVYDIEPYLIKFGQFDGQPLAVAMASYANIYNRRYTKEAMEFQRDCESRGRASKYGYYARDTLRPYVDIRKEIITAYTDRLVEEEIATLATRTRGMRKDDIEKSVQAYLDEKTLPHAPSHPTNTCDPYTGNWQEHLMDPNTLVAALAQGGFNADWLSGYLSCRGPSALKRLGGRAANATIRLLNKSAAPIAPFYLICGTRG